MVNPQRDTTAGRVFNDLRNLARKSGRGTEEVMLGYTLERFLFRIAETAPKRFVLKDGMLLSLFDARRTTRDIDLLGVSMDGDLDAVREDVAAVAGHELDDGVVFDATAIKTAVIREDADYAGVRVTLPASIARARLKLSLDINFGDPVTPGFRTVNMPQLLEEGTFTLLGYPIETVIAEKLATAMALGDANTRDRDYADLCRLVTTHTIDGDIMTDALAATTEYRGTPRRPLTPILRTLGTRRQGSYSAWRAKQQDAQDAYPPEFADVVEAVRAFADMLADGGAAGRAWDPQTRSWR
jgi:Nucleotidyl transferase AbiEii toxin, Type IV TA system